MKKLMIAVAAVACATVGLADDITSNNIVGYAGNETTAVTSPMFGFTFVPVDGATSNKLGNVKAENMDPGQDKIQVIDPETLDATESYTYYSDAAAYQQALDEADDPDDPVEVADLYEANKKNIGWWIYGSIGEAGCSRDNTYIAVGSGFLGQSPFKNNIKFTCNGEAPTKSTQYAPGNVTSPIIANYLPADSCLKDIVVENMDPGQDKIQVIDPETLDATESYTYYSDAAAYQQALDEADDPDNPVEVAELYEANKKNIGWWIYGSIGEAGCNRDNQPVKAAAGFLGQSPFKNNLIFKFKSCLDVTKPSAE